MKKLTQKRRATISAAILLVVATGAFANCETAAAAAKPIARADISDATWKRRQALYAYNKRAPLDARLISRQVNNISVVERYTIRGAKGDLVPLLLVIPRATPNAATSNAATSSTRSSSFRASGKMPVLISIHGLLGNIDQMLFFAQISAKSGYATIIPEIVAHGERSRPGQDLLGGSIDFLHDGIVESVGDIRRSIDFLETRPRLDRNRIGIVGVSLGSILGVIAGALDSRVRAVALVVGGGDWNLIVPAKIEAVRQRDRRENRRGALVRRAQSLLEDVDAKNYVSRLAPRPLLMINGRRDNIISPAAARVLFNAARQPKQQIWFQEGHFLPPIAVAAATQKWLDNNLKNRRVATISNKSSTRLAGKTVAR